MKTILNCIGSGVLSFGQSKRLIIPFYLANLASGLLLVIPIASFIDDFIGNSLVRESLDSKIDWGFILEFLHHNSSSLAVFKSFGIIAPLLYLIGGSIRKNRLYKKTIHVEKFQSTLPLNSANNHGASPRGQSLFFRTSANSCKPVVDTKTRGSEYGA